MAALIVHLPSPESETRPLKCERFGSSARLAAVRSSSHDVTTLPRRHTGRKRREDAVEMLHCARLAANHHAVASLQTPHTAAGAYVHVVNPFRRQFLRAANIIHIVGVAAINQDVSRFKMRNKVGDR